MKLGWSPPRRALASALLALGGLALVAVLCQPFWLAPLVGHRLSADSGRRVHFDSIWIGLSSKLEPVMHCRGVHIQNAAWADTRRPLAALQEAVAVFSWQSFGEHRPVIALLTLRGGEVDLEMQADGLRNWRLRQPDDRSPGLVKILAVQPDRLTLRMVHRRFDLEVEATAAPNGRVDAAAAGSDGNASRAGAVRASAPGPGHGPPAGAALEPSADKTLTTRVELNGTWRKVAFAASVATGDIVTLLETGRLFPLRGRIESGGARLDLDGRAGDILREPTIDAHVSLAGNTLAPFRDFVGPHYGEAKSFRVEGQLKAGDHSYALSKAQARIGATDLAGEAHFSHDDARSAVRANVHSESADFADLRWLAGRAPVRAGKAPSTAAPAPASFDFSAARAIDAQVSFEARHLRAAALPLLQSLKMTAALAGGMLTISGLDVGVAQGHATGRAAFDLREKAASAEADLMLHGARVEALLREQPNNKRVTGALQGRAHLQAAGESAAALLASASGTISASLSGATISSLLDAEMGLQGGKILRSMIGGAEPIAVRCAAAVVDLRRGRGRIRTLVIDTARTRTTGSGTIGLPDRTIDLLLTPEAKQSGLFVLDRSIRIHGPMLKPANSLVERGVASSDGACAP
jgi:AsmA family protein